VATTTYLTNPVVTIAIAAGSPVDFSDQCTALELTSTKESLEVTAFGDTARKYTSGLQNNTVTMTMFLSYGATEVESLQAGVGALCTLVMAPASGSASATNPIYTLTGAYLESFTPIAGGVGEMATVDLEFTGGVLTRAVT
jgi:hypothetical protein